MLKFSMICYITESKHNNEQEVSQMLEVDDKAMAYYLIEALFAGGRGTACKGFVNRSERL